MPQKEKIKNFLVVVLKIWRIFFIKRVKIKKIIIEKGKGDLEKTSKKNPPKKAASKPRKDSLWLGIVPKEYKKFIKITEIKTRFKNCPGILKWAKKLIWNIAKK